MSKNRWIIPDVHGNAKTLKALVKKIGLTAKDELYLLGDYINRGPRSKQVLKFIMGLQEQGYQVHPIRGNHEEYMLNAYKEAKKGDVALLSAALFVWLRQGGIATMNSFGAKKVSDIPTKYYKFLKKLPYYYELEDAILVHAGLNFTVKNPLDDKHSMVWRRKFTVKPDKINGKLLIHGHTIMSYSTISKTVKSKKSLSIGLDNGIYLKNKSDYGSLMALELNTRKLLKQKNIDL